MQEGVSLKPYHTFGLDVNASDLKEVKSLEEFKSVYTADSGPKLILGGGSNVLFTKRFEGTVILNRIRGIEIVSQDKRKVEVRVASGENWHSFVQYCIEQDWGGLENLSLIPGTVGAAPMQNIGAYGVEVKGLITAVEYIELDTLNERILDSASCRFGYRESIFKHELKGKVFIHAVRFSLHKSPHQVNTSYGAIREELAEMGVKDPSIGEVSKAVIAIRQSKLPDPKVLGNAGSFFKNPELKPQAFKALLKKFPEMPNYPLTNGDIKVPAGWLIERAGWKGKRVGNTGCHKRQALVLVNYGGASGEEVHQLAQEIIADIKERFGVELKPEVNFV